MFLPRSTSGYHWASTAEGQAYFLGSREGQGAYDRYPPVGVPPQLDPNSPFSVPVYYDQCGWDGLVHDGRVRRRFRFSDSHITGAYKDATHPDNAEIILDDFIAEEFAGILCVSGEMEACREATSSCYIRAGREMWVSDGTDEGTVRVSDIRPGISGADPHFITDLSLNSSVANLPSTYSVESEVDFFQDGNGTTPTGPMLFAATVSPFGTELWRSDGTRAGTRMLIDINRGIASSNPTYLVHVRELGQVFFSASDGVHGRELWITTGEYTADWSSTKLVMDIRSGPQGSDPRFITQMGDTVFFTAFVDGFGHEVRTPPCCWAGRCVIVAAAFVC